MPATHVVLNVPSISCNHCKMAIEGAVRGLSGVQQVEVDVEARSVALDFDADELALEEIEAAVQEEGYEVTGRHVFDS
ncbi:MAG: copper ion binding protein [Thermoleophilia bacterium]